MTRLPSRFRRLDDALADLPNEDEAMMLSELDGYLTGIAVCPDPIMPGEWLPLVWADGEAAPFDDPVDAQMFIDMVMARYNEIVRDLGRGRLHPIFDIDERNGEVLWELWIDGFETAMDLRPDSRAAVRTSGDVETAAALAGMATLVEVARNESALTSAEINEICDEAPGLIPLHVVRLYAWRVERNDVPPSSSHAAKIGRNEPCPCGSGKKHKRCCGSA